MSNCSLHFYTTILSKYFPVEIYVDYSNLDLIINTKSKNKNLSQALDAMESINALKSALGQKSEQLDKQKVKKVSKAPTSPEEPKAAPKIAVKSKDLPLINEESKITGEEPQKPEDIELSNNKVSAEISPELELNEDDLLVLEVEINGDMYEEYLNCYSEEDRYLIPLQEISDVLGMAMNVSAEEGQAKGWIIREENDFFLHLNSSTVTLKGKKTNYQQNLVKKNEEDIYIDSSLLSEWFPAKFNISMSDLVVEVTTQKNFPMQEKLARTERWKNLKESVTEVEKNYETISIPYQAYSSPFIDANINYRTDKSSGWEDSISYTLNSAGDLGYFNTKRFLTGNSEEGITDLRIQGWRNSKEGDILGPLKVKELSVGDITSISSPLIANSSRGRGFSISNVGNSISSEFDLIDIRGDGTPEWELELYRNNALIRVLNIPEDGRYEFNDVPVLYGNNIFRLVFYGPQGQIKEKVIKHDVGGNMIPPGEFNYDFSIDEKSINLIDFGTQRDLTHKKDLRYVGNLNYGLSKYLTSSIGLASTPIEDEIHNYSSMSLISSFLGSIVGINFAYDHTGEYAQKASLITSIKNIRINAEHTKFTENYISETDRTHGKSLSKLGMNFSLPLFFKKRINVGLRSEYEKFFDGSESIQLQNSLTTSLFRVSINNTIDYSIDKSTDNSSEFSDGTLSINGKFKGWLYRGSGNYEIVPETILNDVRLSIQKPFDKFTLKFDLFKELQSSYSTRYNSSLSLNREKYRLAFQLDADDEGEITVSSNLIFSFGKDLARKFHENAQTYVEQYQF